MYLNYKSFGLKLILFFFVYFFILTAHNSFALKSFYRINHSGGYKFKTVIMPGAIKFNKLKLTLFITKNGRPVKNFRGKVSLSMPAMFMGTNIAKFNPVNGKPGEYKTYIYFTMGGLWKLDYILYDNSGGLIRFSNELNVN